MSERKYVVYKHTTPSGKVYIGITSATLKKRWKNGKGYELCTAFNRAIKKYGWENMKHEVLFDGLSKDEACRAEQELIKKYDSTNPEKGYNLTSGGEHYEPTDEWRERLSQSEKRFFAEHPEVREKISAMQRGRKTSEETKEKIRLSMRKVIEAHPERRERCRMTFKGMKRPEEFCRALGERKSKAVLCTNTGQAFRSVKEAAETMNVSRTGISNVLHGRAKTCGGFTFELETGGRR